MARSPCSYDEVMATTESKAVLRRRLREWRRALSSDDITARSQTIVEQLKALIAQRDAHVVMLYSAIHGEPDLSRLAAWCWSNAISVVVPEDDLGSIQVDVVVAPGVAFTAAGDRLGQGGGWYDRFLAAIPSSVLIVGVCFEEQVLGSLPVEDHDVRVHRVIVG